MVLTGFFRYQFLPLPQFWLLLPRLRVLRSDVDGFHPSLLLLCKCSASISYTSSWLLLFGLDRANTVLCDCGSYIFRITPGFASFVWRIASRNLRSFTRVWLIPKLHILRCLCILMSLPQLNFCSGKDKLQITASHILNSDVKMC